MPKNNKLLIIGSHGMLGQESVRVFSADRDYAVTAWDKPEIDITDPRQVARKIAELRPAVILNAAAYNAVDKCENNSEEYALAKKLNGSAPGYLAKAAQKIGATLVHFSSDYVFDGRPEIDLEPSGCTHSCGSCRLHENFAPLIGFKEDAKPKPLSNYGKSKLMGEKAVAKGTKKHYILRLSKLFGQPGSVPDAKRSFFDVMLEAGRKNKSVKAIDEETSCFTYAPDLARKTKELIEAGKPFGIYHIINSHPATWYEAAVELFRLAGLKTKVIPISSEEFPRPAERPFLSTLLNTKLNPLRDYREALRDYLKTAAPKSLTKRPKSVK